jgi:hypothetical protein
MNTSDIEKKSLETHVELCAERYKFLEEKLENVEESVSSAKKLINEVHAMVHSIVNKRNDQLIGWGLGVIGFLLATVGWLITHYVIK